MLRLSRITRLSSCPVILSRSLGSVLSVWPSSSLLDTEVRVAGTGLEAGRRVRLETRLEDGEQGRLLGCRGYPALSLVQLLQC